MTPGISAAEALMLTELVCVQYIADKAGIRSISMMSLHNINDTYITKDPVQRDLFFNLSSQALTNQSNLFYCTFEIWDPQLGMGDLWFFYWPAPHDLWHSNFRCTLIASCLGHFFTTIIAKIMWWCAWWANHSRWECCRYTVHQWHTVPQRIQGTVLLTFQEHMPDRRANLSVIYVVSSWKIRYLQGLLWLKQSILRSRSRMRQLFSSGGLCWSKV